MMNIKIIAYGITALLYSLLLTGYIQGYGGMVETTSTILAVFGVMSTAIISISFIGLHKASGEYVLCQYRVTSTFELIVACILTPVCWGILYYTECYKLLGLSIFSSTLSVFYLYKVRKLAKEYMENV